MSKSLKIVMAAMEEHGADLAKAKLDNNMKQVDWHLERLWYWQDLYRQITG